MHIAWVSPSAFSSLGVKRGQGQEEDDITWLHSMGRVDGKGGYPVFTRFSCLSAYQQLLRGIVQRNELLVYLGGVLFILACSAHDLSWGHVFAIEGC